MSLFAKNISFLQSKGKFDPAKLAEALQLKPENLEKAIDNPSTKELVIFSEFLNLSLDKLIKVDLEKVDQFSKDTIKFLVLDVDGVLTDGGMYYTEGGDEFKKFNTKDGMGIKNLTKNGFPVGIISSGFNEKLIKSRADLLGIKHVYVGTDPKLSILEQWVADLGIALENVAFIGDDINDERVMEAVGLAACPANAMKPVRLKSAVVLTRNGGDACVREFIDGYLTTN